MKINEEEYQSTSIVVQETCSNRLMQIHKEFQKKYALKYEKVRQLMKDKIENDG